MEKTVEIGSKKQLLFDRLFLENAKGVALEVHRPIQDTEPVLVPEKAWENKGVGCYNTVMQDEGRLRMWYDSFGQDSSRHRRRFLCHAESSDGIHWDRPKAGLVSYNGSKNNNIVAPPTTGGKPSSGKEDYAEWSGEANMQGGTVFRDDHGAAPERYKLWTKYQASVADNKRGIGTGLWAMVSPDGLKWKLLDQGYPLTGGSASDTQSIPFWDEDLKKYAAFVRMKKFPKGRQRTCSVGVMYSDDFRTWSQAREVYKADGPDSRSPVPDGRPGWVPTVDFYVPGGMKVPGVPNAYILLPTPYYHWREDAFPSNIDVRLATSRDGIHWWQDPDREPFLRLGPDGSPYSGMIFANPWPILMKDEIWIYYSGRGYSHSERVRKASQTGIYCARLRRDGFVSVTARYGGGEFTTPAVKFTGKRLMLNMDGSAGGWLKVELLTEGGRSISSFTLKGCDTIRGNSLKKPVSWKGKTDLSKLSQKPVRLRFVMRSMRLYSFQFIR